MHLEITFNLKRKLNIKKTPKTSMFVFGEPNSVTVYDDS